MSEAGPLLVEAERLLTERRLAEALAAFHQAEAAGEDPARCSAGRWMAHMLLGDFAPAWAESDATRRRGTPDPHRFWQGEPLTGTRVIVRSLHGFGDAVQMLRYAPRLAAEAGEVVYEVAPRFVELAPCFDGVGRVITWGEDAPAEPPAWEVQCEVLELPFLFQTTMPELPLAERYLRLPETALAATTRAMAYHGRSGPQIRPRVGLVWTAGEWNPERSCPAEVIRGLLAVSGVEFWSLQHGDRDEVSVLGSGVLSAVAVCGDGLLALAAVIAALDLIITVDTLAAHLAGALGVPAWVMLQHAADWRWMHGRDDSPWYPGMRLFRQPRPGNWAAVSEAVRNALSRFSTEGRAGRLAV